MLDLGTIQGLVRQKARGDVQAAVTLDQLRQVPGARQLIDVAERQDYSGPPQGVMPWLQDQLNVPQGLGLPPVNPQPPQLPFAPAPSPMMPVAPPQPLGAPIAPQAMPAPPPAPLNPMYQEPDTSLNALLGIQPAPFAGSGWQGAPSPPPRPFAPDFVPPGNGGLLPGAPPADLHWTPPTSGSEPVGNQAIMALNDFIQGLGDEIFGGGAANAEGIGAPAVSNDDVTAGLAALFGAGATSGDGSTNLPGTLPPSADYARIEALLDQAAPKAPEKRDRWADVIAGLAAGAAGADPMAGLGQMLLQTGAGGITGYARAMAAEDQQAQDYTQQQREYALTRAGVESDLISARMQDSLRTWEAQQPQVLGTYRGGVTYSVRNPDGTMTIKQSNPATALGVASSNSLFRGLGAGDAEIDLMNDSLTVDPDDPLAPAYVMLGKILEREGVSGFQRLFDQFEGVNDAAQEAGMAAAAATGLSQGTEAYAQEVLKGQIAFYAQQLMQGLSEPGAARDLLFGQVRNMFGIPEAGGSAGRGLPGGSSGRVPEPN